MIFLCDDLREDNAITIENDQGCRLDGLDGADSGGARGSFRKPFLDHSHIVSHHAVFASMTRKCFAPFKRLSRFSSEVFQGFSGKMLDAGQPSSS